MGLRTRKAVYPTHIKYPSTVHILALYMTYSHGNNPQTLPLSYQPACPPPLTCHSKPCHPHMTLQAVHKEPPSAPFYSASQDLQTSYCMHNHYYISPDGGIGQSDYKDKDIPMSCCHKSYL